MAAGSVPSFLTAAVADSSRPAADTQRDAARKPAESMAFAGVQPKSQVIELIPGGGYYTRLLSKAVGPDGRLYALVPALPPDAPAGTPDRAVPIKAIAAEKGYGNVTVLVQPIRALDLPPNADLAWTSDNYHDLHNAKGLDMLAFNKSVWTALKPGGVYLVIDHAAAANAPDDVTSTLHRIRPETVIKEVEAAGFKLTGQSSVLHNTTDSHELKVFDPAIQGKTDQFMLRFMKPLH
jgi:predicted methyltransferase